MVHARRTRHKKKRVSHLINLVILFGVGSFFFVVGVLVLWASFLKLPDFQAFHDRKIVQSTKIYDRTGKILLYDVHQDVKRTLVPFEEIPESLKKATLAIEDTDFYVHGPISVRGLGRAILYGGTRGGGSTITQQVIKKTLLTDEKLITRKMKEIILSFKLEQVFSKDEILNIYFNEIPYGGSVYGVGEATKVFFGKTPKEITLAESAYLAALPNAPTYYSPYGNHRADLEERKNLVLSRMKVLGFISEEEYRGAQMESVVFLPKEPTGIRAPHFVEWIKEYLVKKYGESAILENGYRVITTLNYDLQTKAEEVIAKFSPDVEKNFEAKNMALVAIDPTNGQVLAMVGSRDYFDIENDGNFNVTIAHRQPGSTFKPFVYATAFMKGYTPETTVFDLKTNFSTNCDASGVPTSPEVDPESCYMPENYDGKFRGPVSLREALAQSLNIPAVKTLYLAGLGDSLATARRMGIGGLNDPDRYGLTLVLGGGEVSLIDLTSAYGVFANDGLRNPTVSILRIEDKNGEVVEGFSSQPEQVIPLQVARQITNILSDNIARTPEFGANSALYFPNKDVAVKTGTTNDYRDVWTVGYTPHVAVGMWAGNNDNTPIHKNIAGFIITPTWHAFMDEVFRLTPEERFIAPEPEDLSFLPAPLQGIWRGGEKYTIDTTSGKLATPLTPKETQSVVVVPEVHNILHWVNKNDPRGIRPLHPEIDPQYNLWESPVRTWVEEQKIIEGDRTGIPFEYDTNHTPENNPILSITGPILSSPLPKTTPITFVVTGSGVFPLSRVDLFINNTLVDQKLSAPFIFNLNTEKLSTLSSSNDLVFFGYDSVFNKTTISQKLLLN